MRYLATILLSMLALAGPVHANPSTPQPPIKVVLAPLATLGSEARAAATKKVRAPLIAALAAVPGFELIADSAVERALTRSKRPELRSCDGAPACLADLGKLVAADHVVYGELGGLGDVQIVYLKLVSTADAREVRATSLEIAEGLDPNAAARAAAFRLLSPAAYVGTLAIDTEVANAAIYVDGRLAARTPTPPIDLQVGTHALRVTHPEFRDFVRFVTIDFSAEQRLPVTLEPFGVVSSDLEATPDGKPATSVIYRGVEPTPWYRRWYAVAGLSAATLIGSAVIVGLIVNGIDADRETTIGDP